MDLPNKSPWSRLEQNNQSSRSISPTSLGSSNGDLELMGDDPYDGGGDASDRDPQNMDDGAPKKQESGQDASAATVGGTACDASCGCDTSPNIE